METRHKNIQWRMTNKGVLNKDGTRGYPELMIHTALLMDLRDELQELNRTLHCVNFLSIPNVLRAIERNTMKKPKLQKRKRHD